MQWGLMITVYCISYAPALLLLKIPGFDGQNVLLMIYLLLVVQISDVLQYVFGKLFGKPKIAPRGQPVEDRRGLRRRRRERDRRSAPRCGGSRRSRRCSRWPWRHHRGDGDSSAA